MNDELVAIDDALETGVADHPDPLTRELQELALALRADAPQAEPGFQRQLRGRVERGFAKATASRRPQWPRISTPALATGLVVLPLVLIAVVAGVSGPSDENSDGGGGASVTLESEGDGGGAVGSGAGALARAGAEPETDKAGSGSGPPRGAPPGRGLAPGPGHPQ